MKFKSTRLLEPLAHPLPTTSHKKANQNAGIAEAYSNVGMQIVAHKNYNVQQGTNQTTKSHSQKPSARNLLNTPYSNTIKRSPVDLLYHPDSKRREGAKSDQIISFCCNFCILSNLLVDSECQQFKLSLISP